jgi:hypothetical protein
MLALSDGKGYHEIPLTHAYAENSRGIGLSDMAQCLIDGSKPRAGSNLTNHVLEIMCAIDGSEQRNSIYKMQTEFEIIGDSSLGV